MVISRSAVETQKIAARFAKKLVKMPPKKAGALVITLQGELGAGKTTFVQSFARALGIKQRPTSPTFLIMRSYKMPFDAARGARVKSHRQLLHVDAYRLKNTAELEPLHFKKYIGDPQNIVLVEWPERIRGALPKKIVEIRLGHGKKENERIIDLR